jgi:allophanate hydrolase
MNINMTLSALRAAYLAKALTPQAVVNEVQQRCDGSGAHNIWITRLNADQLRPYLERLDRHDPVDLPLYGIPFAIKDNIDLAGVPTTAACAAFAYTPERSAFVVQRLIDAGAIPVGKTNMDQFATGLVGTRSPQPWGACRNAFDTQYISGGSSSGSAVSVALGLVSFSLGTDTAGSGRVPAAFNNIIGVKPSRGLLSMQGVVRACRSLDCVSIFALTTDDANTVLEQVAVFDPQDDYARHNPFANNRRHYGLPPDSFRFGVPQPAQLNFFGNDPAQALYQASVERLLALGGTKVEVDFTPFLDAARLLYEGPWVAERYAAIEDIITQRPDALLPVIRSIIGGARDKTAVDGFKAGYRMQHYRRQALAVFDHVDFMVTPTAGTIYTVDEVLADPVRLNSNLGYYTNYLNLLDCAAVAVPAGFLPNGLPWGMSFIAPAMQDRKLLSYAHRWQQALGLRLGALDLVAGISATRPLVHTDHIPLVVCGAHLTGLPLNWQLTERGARLMLRTTTAQNYRLYSLPGGPPHRPALVRDPRQGARIEVEVWAVPTEQLGGFVAAIPAPLAVGKVELDDGRWLPGFVCEPYGVETAREITALGGWKAYLQQAE